MGLKAGYKQSEFGPIPDDWQLWKLGSIGKPYGGLTGKRKQDFGHGSAVYIPFMNVMANIRIDCSALERVDVSASEPQNCVARGDLLINGSSETPEELGVAAVLTEEMDRLFLNSFCFGFRLRNQQQHSSRFLAYFFRGPFGRALMRALAQGSTRHNLSKTALMNLEIPLPEFGEQEAIAEVLSDTDALIDTLERLIAKKRDIKRGVMQELLSGRRRLVGFAGSWMPRLFGELASPRKKRIDPRLQGSSDFCLELEHLNQRTGSLAGFTATTQNSSLKTMFHKGDVLFGRLRAYLRKYWLATQDGVCSTEIWALEPRQAQVIPEFLFQLVMTDAFIEAASQAYGTHMPRSDWNVVNVHEVLVPPSIEEQSAISTALIDMDSEILALEVQADKTRMLKAGLMQELLTGRIRLV